MRIAIEGCSHGRLDQIYSSIRELDRRVGQRTDLLLLCGDVQTLRNRADFHCLAVPDKYKQLGDFHRYYDGQNRRAPILTIMIGGNHEASNYLWELYYGGWVAPNIYYLGAAGCVEVGGITIAGISGIYKSHDYRQGRYESMPYNTGTIRSIYHTREFDVFRLRMLQACSEATRPQIVLSHDWPNTIERHGDTKWLMQKKPFFRKEIQTNTLGSPPLLSLLQELKPTYWFSAHLHVRYAALFKHNGSQTSVTPSAELKQVLSMDKKQDPSSDLVTFPSSEDNKMKDSLNSDEINIEVDSPDANEIDIDDNNIGLTADQGVSLKEDVINDEERSDNQRQEDLSANASTRFLALSKCLEGQDFLQILTIPAPYDADDSYQTQDNEYSEVATKQPTLRFSAAWLAILRTTDPYLSLDRHQKRLPALEDAISIMKKEQDWVKLHCHSHSVPTENKGTDDHPLAIRRTQCFVQTAPPSLHARDFGPPPWYTNPQTVAFCSFIGLKNQINAPPPDTPPHNSEVPYPFSEEQEIEKIKAAAHAAMERKTKHYESSNDVLTLENDNEEEARWKEGSG